MGDKRHVWQMWSQVKCAWARWRCRRHGHAFVAADWAAGTLTTNGSGGFNVHFDSFIVATLCGRCGGLFYIKK